MQRRSPLTLLLGLTVLLVPLMSRLSAGAPASDPAAIPGNPFQAAPTAPLWYRDYDVARTLAVQTGKPLFVVFRCER